MMRCEYLLYPDCVIVNGASKSAIYDLRRGKILFIPDSLYDILDKYKGFPFSKLKQLYPKEHDTIIEYLKFLLSEDLLFKTESNVLFDNLSLFFETPYVIDNIIIDINATSNHDYNKISNELQYLGCPNILFRFYDKITVPSLIEILHVFLDSRVRDIVILLPYQPFITKEIKKNILKLRIVSEITIHSSPCNRLAKFQDLRFVFTTKKIVDESHCGAISLRNFSININMFLDSKNYNNCLHKKISIDRSGNIKNCPSSPINYGNHSNCSLIDAVNKEGFKKMWYIKKDDIDSCKLCVFRYMCIDCRIYLSDSDNILSKPLKCRYDVYKDNDEDNLRI